MAADKAPMDTEIIGASNEKGDRRSFPQMSNLSPYTLLSRDIPEALLTHIKLKGDNYDHWSLSFLGSRRAKWKDCFINGTATTLDRDSLEYAN